MIVLNLPSMKSGILIKIFFVLSLILIATIPNIANAQDYSNEFNEPNEQVSKLGTWTYLTADKIERTVDIYQYCGTSCILVLFDVRDNVPLTSSQTESFFENYQLKQIVDKGQLSESTYTISYSNPPICQVFAPEFFVESKNLAVQVAAEKILPDVLPKNAGKIVAAAYEAGENFGIVDSVNVPILLIGASCVGGDALEVRASSILTSCQYYVKNLEKSYSYEGQAQDLENCHAEAIQNLELNQGNPKIIYSHIQTQAGNIMSQVNSTLQSLGCDLSKVFGGNCTVQGPVIQKSDLDKLETQIKNLQNVGTYVNSVTNSSQSLSTDSTKRISLKSGEAVSAIISLNSSIASDQNLISSFNDYFGLKLLWLNLFYTPGYDFSSNQYEIGLASQKLTTSEQLFGQYRFNTAMIAAYDGQKDAMNTNSAIIAEINKQRNINYFNVFVAVIVLVVLLVLFFAGKSKGGQA